MSVVGRAASGMGGARALRIMVTGSHGQLGRCLADAARLAAFQEAVVIHGVARRLLDITDAAAVNDAVQRLAPDVVINAAAWTDVDAAESCTAGAMRVNAHGAGHVAAAAARHGARVIQISTDYVFGDGGDRPWTESDRPSPLNAYGASKLAGEQAVQARAPDALVVRTAALYSVHGRNFVKAILARARDGLALRVVDDQVTSPTSAADLATTLLMLALRAEWLPGIFHYAGPEAMSWHELARRALVCAARHDARDARVALAAVSSRERPAAAQRPEYSALDSSRLQRRARLGPQRPTDQDLACVVSGLLSSGSLADS